ncbi:MAG: hypothetical protein FWG90_06825 [Oscillospiraceae bacterium]|nr:hypothetical protein [Oscillospiraceae bacterium]
MAKIMRIMGLCLAWLFCLAGCGGDGGEADLPNVSIFESARGSIETTMTEAETEKEITAEPIIIDGQKYYYDGMELVFNNWFGMGIKIASYKAARAYLRNDREELATYLLDSDVSVDFNECNIFDDTLAYMSLATGKVISESEMQIGYVIAEDFTDELLYMNITLINSGIIWEWKVSAISVESVTSPAPIVIDERWFYYNGIEAVYNYWEDMDIKTASYKAAKAFLNGDSAGDELAKLLLNPNEVDYWGISGNNFVLMGYMSLVYINSSDEAARIGYVLAFEEENEMPVIYLDMELIKSENTWKIEEIYLQG